MLKISFLTSDTTARLLSTQANSYQKLFFLIPNKNVHPKTIWSFERAREIRIFLAPATKEVSKTSKKIAKILSLVSFHIPSFIPFSPILHGILWSVRPIHNS